MNIKKILKYLAIIVVALIIIAIIGKKLDWFGGEEAIKVSSEKAKRRTITEQISTNGKIQPETQIKISSEVSGEIIKLNVKEGQEVKTGDLLVKINPELYLAGIDRMTASLNGARSNLANSKARLAQINARFKKSKLSFARNKKLWKDKAISDAEYETALSEFEVSKADVEAAQESVNSAKYTVMSSEAALREAKENLNKTSIYAPMSGIVSKLNVEVGERVLGTIQMSGTEIMRIADLDKMEVQVNVNENDIIKVKYRDTAIIEVDAYLGKTFKGIVTEIANSASVAGAGTDVVTNFEVKILILKDSYKSLITSNKSNYFPFRPGMSATADIQTNTRYGVLSVPIQAITVRKSSEEPKDKDNDSLQESKKDIEGDKNKELSKDDKTIEVLFAIENGEASMIEVKTGIQDDKYIEILEGISDSLEIITAPYSVISKKLNKGTKVEKVEKENLF